MSLPELQPVDASDLSPASLRAMVPPEAGPVRFFRVTSTGRFDGRVWAEDEVIVVGGRALVDDRVVLVPSGRGRLALGHVRRDGLRGSSGEACAPGRWSVSGRVLRVWGARAARPAQLSLFAA